MYVLKFFNCLLKYIQTAFALCLQIILPEHLELCRKLLVLYYLEKYPSISSVFVIMDRCFDKNDINVILAERQHILCQWREFKTNSKLKNNFENKCMKT